jgi:membrane-associated phospholipid phosphatase
VHPLHPFRRDQEGRALMIERRPEWPPRLARLISIAAHPFVLSPLTVALASRNWRWTAIVVASTMLPITAVILWNMRRGVWSDFDVSRREQRSSLYWVAIPLLAALAFLVPAFSRSMLALVCVLLVGLALSRFLKTSLHLLFAAFCAVVLWKVYPWSAFVMLAVLAALAWSRWRLQRHTPVEIAVGTLLGLAAGIYTIG